MADRQSPGGDRVLRRHEEGPFDIILSEGMIHHLSDPATGLKHLADFLTVAKRLFQDLAAYIRSDQEIVDTFLHSSFRPEPARREESDISGLIPRIVPFVQLQSFQNWLDEGGFESPSHAVLAFNDSLGELDDIHLDRREASLIRACDGQRTVSHIIEEVAQEKGCSEDREDFEAVAFFRRLEQAKALYFAS